MNDIERNVIVGLCSSFCKRALRVLIFIFLTFELINALKRRVTVFKNVSSEVFHSGVISKINASGDFERIYRMPLHINFA